MVINSITIKDDYTFLVSDVAGEIKNGLEGHGLYFQDTRYLSDLRLTIDGESPQQLSYNADYNIAATFQLSSSHITQLHSEEGVTLAPAWTMVSHAVGITRRRFIRRGLIENLEFTNYHSTSVTITVGLSLAADFADIFEVRGFPHTVRGLAATITPGGGGRQLDFRSVPTSLRLPTRLLRFQCDRKPDSYVQNAYSSPLNRLRVPEITLFFNLELPPQQPFALNLAVMPEPEQNNLLPTGQGSGVQAAANFAASVASLRQVFAEWKQVCTRIETGDYVLNRIFETSLLDLRSLMQQEPQGLTVTAGLPWYFTLFGRDSLITAMQALSLNPQIAVDTLRVLAAYQADGFDDRRDSEPGKILHELRRGDMTLSGEMPHSPYYGSVDSTILFILCFAETLRWLDDASLFAELWPNVERALHWCEQYGDADRDGYIEFERRSKDGEGILHQGWKDSNESMGGSTGPHPKPPIALVEVQGYYYAAKIGLAATLRQYGDSKQKQLAGRLETEAAQLKQNFNRDFWWEEEGFLAQALDGQKKQVRNVTSNPGHCLWNGIVDEDKVGRVVKRLMQPDMLCGWGIRTMSARDLTYNPMSYHNGSIWPHDNALIIAGLRRYGFTAEAVTVIRQLFDAATTFPDFRLPELYCGFARREAEEHAPAAYPVSCSPQAWAAGTPILLLQTLLGLEPDAPSRQVKVAPVLPQGIAQLNLLGLRVGHSRMDLSFRRDPATGNVTVNSNGGNNSEQVLVSLQPGQI